MIYALVFLLGNLLGFACAAICAAAAYADRCEERERRHWHGSL